MTKNRYKQQKRLERNIGFYKHSLELVRTIVPVLVLLMQVVILWKVI